MKTFGKLLEHMRRLSTFRLRFSKVKESKRSDRTRMMVEMNVTPSQGLALKAMFEYWNALASSGGSRQVGFYVDGDGNFHPNCKITFEGTMPELTKEMKEAAIVEDKGGDRVYDFDPIAWMLDS